jgi:deazaflavin-dependent oxidoreductase (nitroreductase family)
MSGPGNYNQNIIDQFRANSGKTNHPLPLLLLTTTGAKSGETRTNPVAYTRDGDRYIIIASKGGAPINPAWYFNLLAHPLVTVEVGTDRFQARATPAEGAEWERLYDQQATQMPGFAEYRKKTSRHIPVIILDRIGN